MNQLYTFQSPHLQRFTLPMTYRAYIFARRDHPEVYRKLSQTCKLFYARDQLIAINGFKWEIHDDGGQLIQVDTSSARGLRDVAVETVETSTAKLWIYGQLEVSNYAGIMFPREIFDKTAYIRLSKLTLAFVFITFDEYLTLTASRTIHTIDLYKTLITKSNGKVAALDDLLGQVLNIVSFTL